MFAALAADRVATMALLLVAGLAIIGVVVAVLARTVLVKVVAAVALFALAAAVWIQRAALDDCVQQIEVTATGTSGAPPCEFLGLKVDVKAP